MERKILSAVERTFVEAMVRDGNATKAAIEAGYPEKTAGQAGRDVRKRAHVAEALRYRLEQADQARSVNDDWVVTRLAGIASTNIAKITLMAQTLDDWQDRLTEAEQLSIASIELTPTGPKLKFHDALKATELIGRIRGMYQDRLKLDAGSVPVRLVVEFGGPGENAD